MSIKYKYIIIFLIIFISPILTSAETIIRAPIIIGNYKQIEASKDGSIELTIENKEVIKLQNDIKAREEEIRSSNEETKKLLREISEIYKQKDTLQKELDTISLTNKITESQIRTIRYKIEESQATLKKLETQIGSNTSNIDILPTILADSYRKSNELELNKLEQILSSFNYSFFDIGQRVVETERFSKSLSNQLSSLRKETKNLKTNRQETLGERQLLKNREQSLQDKRKLYQETIKIQQALIDKTKNDEATYQKLLETKRNEQQSLKQEVYEFESRIDFIKNPNSIPETKKGLFKIPFKNARVRVTQNFGVTAFARANVAKYGRAFHDGIDFGIPYGTEIISSAEGIVIGTGNTDLLSSCQSWGKWIVVRHTFGLTTLYAHLSLIKVRIGEKVSAGQLIGYSGNTGFSTGPHLHYGVYDSSGIKIVPYESVTKNPRCRGLLVPVAAQQAKLNPRYYLPNL